MTQKDKKIIELYLSGMTMKDVGKHFGYKSGNTVSETLKKHNVTLRSKSKVHSLNLDEDKIIGLYEKGLSAYEIKKKLKLTCNVKTIYNILQKNNVKMRSKAGNKNPNLVHNYFEKIDNEVKAYFVGFLVADGSVGYDGKRTPCIGLQIKSEDGYIIQALKDVLKTDNKVGTSKDGSLKRIRVHSMKMFNDLAQYHIVPNKTFKTQLPENIPKKYLHHFIRGYFDGDGWTYNKQISKNAYRTPICFCGTRKLMTQLRDHFHEELGTYNVKVRKTNNIYTIGYYSKNDTQVLKNYMYKDSTIFLKRKYNVLHKS